MSEDGGATRKTISHRATEIQRKERQRDRERERGRENALSSLFLSFSLSLCLPWLIISWVQIRLKASMAFCSDLCRLIKGNMPLSCLSISWAFFNTSSARSLGTTTTPSSSATIISPGCKVTPAHSTGTFLTTGEQCATAAHGSLARICAHHTH